MSQRHFVIPDNNLGAFSILYSIEVGIRELIIEQMSKVYGAQWVRTAVPAAVNQKTCNAERCHQVGVGLLDHHNDFDCGAVSRGAANPLRLG